MFHINHIHIKSRDPKKSADWFAKAFNLTILSDVVREVGDRFIRCQTEDGALRMIFSGNRRDETLPEGVIGVHLGLEHFGVDSTDIHTDVARLMELGAELTEGPMEGQNGQWIAFLNTPEGVRDELIQPAKQ